MNRLRQFAVWLFDPSAIRGQVAVSVLVSAIGAILIMGSALLESLVLKGVVTVNGELRFAQWLSYSLSGFVIFAVAVVLFVVWRPGPIDQYKSLTEQVMDATDSIARLLQSADYVFESDYRVMNVGVDGRDTFEINWEIVEAKDAVDFVTLDWNSDEAMVTLPRLEVEVSDGFKAIAVPRRNHRLQKGWLIYLSPSITSGLKLTCRFPWKNFWEPLRKSNADYIEYYTKNETRRAKIEINIPAELGDVLWADEFAPAPGVRLSHHRTPGGGTRLTFEIDNPIRKEAYRQKLRRAT